MQTVPLQPVAFNTPKTETSLNQPGVDTKSAARIKWTFGDYVGLIGGGIGIVSLAVSLVSLNISHRAYDRSTGKIGAGLEILALLPHDDQVRPGFRTKTGFGGMSAVVFQNLDDLLAFNPTVVVMNSCSEIVDELRVQTKFVGGMINTIKSPPEVQRKKTPWVIEQAKEENYHLNAKLNPRQQARASITRGIVAQMVQAQPTDERINIEHLGMFEVRVFGHAVGAPEAFDAAKETGSFSFVWIPAGFPEDRCKKLISTMQPDVEILEKGPQ